MLRRTAVPAAVIAMLACNPTGTPAPSPEPLAADQTLSFPLAQDVADFDPAMISSPADVDVLRNVFSGLYRWDDHLNEVPDIATAAPSVSADGLTYTFRMRTDARFSNGDPISADDVLYSWNRAAARQGDFAGLFDLIAGYGDVAAGKTKQMSGLAKVDASTVTATLVRPAGYFPTLVGLWPFWLVDQKVIGGAGEDAWTTRPETLVGSGPFRMTARAPGQSMDFEPVTGWYGGKTGALTRVHVQVVADTEAQVAQYESGVFGLVGYGRQALSPDAATRYVTDAKLKSQLSLVPLGASFWVGFNMRTGPFAGDAGRAGRHAFSEAIDRKALVAAVCNSGTSCAAATGGVVSKGLRGYLGDGQDHNVKFDAKAAKAEYSAWDADGAKVKGLNYVFDSNPFNKAVCANLQQQWRTNLGVSVGCVEELDRKTFFDRRNGACAYALFRQSWTADYDHPQDWFDYLFVSGASSSGSCYANPNLDRVVAKADAAPLSATASDYRTAGYVLVNDTVFAGLLYGVQQYLVHPYVKGAGGNALYDNPWTEVRIVQHQG
jgi:ABC-type oligopeptide transport system substrate-binding subunit